MKENKIKALKCLWKEAKLYSKLYYETEDKFEKNTYVKHFRSPIFDETNVTFFKKDYISLKAFNKEGRITDEHCNGRTNCAKKIFEKIFLGEINTFEEFIDFLKNYCYTIKILSEENTSVSVYLKKNKDKNFIEAYNELGIIICDKKGNIIKDIDLPVI